MKKFFWAILLLIVIPWQFVAGYNHYFVQFTDKNNTPYSLFDPLEYLSQRAIDRRVSYKIPIDSTDLPVNPSYVQQIQNTGATVLYTTKWMNGAIIIADSAQIDAIKKLACIKFTELTKNDESISTNSVNKKSVKNDTAIYNYSFPQNDLINLIPLHNMGYKGQDMQIAILDAGFYGANTSAAFDSLRLQGRLLGTKDFVNPNSDIYEENYHGAYVLSTIAGNMPNQFIGTAPDVSVWLIRSEDANSEWPVEADYWVCAAEFADSAGVDLINSSLGYSVFDDTTLSYKYSDLNGKNCRISRAATMAARKGIIVCNSAGNEGSNSWHYIITPADADSILAVGAVDTAGKYAYFSSTGPSSDGRIKPDIAAVGYHAYGVNNDTPVNISGTSFSSPISCGMMACLHQALPKLNNIQLINLVKENASQSDAPDSLLGYGIPNAWKIYQKGVELSTAITDNHIDVYPNPAKNTLYIYSDDKIQQITIYNLQGLLVAQPQPPIAGAINIQALTAGIYILKISVDNQDYTSKFIKK